MPDLYEGFQNYKVKLVSVASLRFNDPGRIERVIFDVTPGFNENRNVEYEGVQPIHMPGAMQVYKKTQSRTFNISAKFISRNVDEATQNMLNLQTLRGWTMPYFGSGSATGQGASTLRQREEDTQRLNILTNQSSASNNQDTGSKAEIDAIRRRLQSSINLLGAPPDVLYLYAYSKHSSRTGGNDLVNVNRVPVVMTSLGIDYPEDVDYLPTNFRNKDPMPISMTVTINLVETHSPREYERFSLADFKAGRLTHF